MNIFNENMELFFRYISSSISDLIQVVAITKSIFSMTVLFYFLRAVTFVRAKLSARK